MRFLFSLFFLSRVLSFLSRFLFIYSFWCLWKFIPVSRNFYLFSVLKLLIKISPDQPKFPPNLVRTFRHFLHPCIFLFPNSFLNLKVYDTFNMQTNILKTSFFFFLLKGKKGAIFFLWGTKRTLFILWKGKQGATPFWNCQGKKLLLIY